MQGQRRKTRRELSETVEAFQNLLISYATGGIATEDEFKRCRTELLAEPLLRARLPRLVRTCRGLKQFWGFIEAKSAKYQGRREFLWDQFRSILEFLEEDSAPADDTVSDMLAKFDTVNVHTVWARALERRSEDPEGAITSARTLLETVCKHILDESGAEYEESADLPRLYRLTAEALDLAPDQQAE